jgi:hypothetical protein
MSFTNSYHCLSRVHCATCRKSAIWREQIGAPDVCPYGITIPPLRGLGDVVARVTSAIGIKPCGGCKQRQQKLNELVPFKAG